MIEESKNTNLSINETLKHFDKPATNVSGISVFMERVHSVNGLQLISAISQIFLGLTVVALSLIGTISPLWLSTIMTVFGSISVVIGICLLFNAFNGKHSFDTLLHQSIKRVIHSQN